MWFGHQHVGTGNCSVISEGNWQFAVHGEFPAATFASQDFEQGWVDIVVVNVLLSGVNLLVESRKKSVLFISKRK